jgi:hypothetical protein
MYFTSYITYVNQEHVWNITSAMSVDVDKTMRYRSMINHVSEENLKMTF